MAEDEAGSGGAEDPNATGTFDGDELDEGAEPTPFFVEAWNDYDPSQKFAVIYPLSIEENAAASTVAYTIIEPGKHTGLHADSAEEIVFVAEGEGEVFSIGATQRIEAGKFVVFPPGMDHDVYAQGSVALRLMSFFPAPEVVSTYQQVMFPMGTNELSSKPPTGPVITELDPNNLPDDFPFDLADLGMAERAPDEPRELTMTERLIGMTSPDDLPPDIGPGNVIDPQNPPPSGESAEDEGNGDEEVSGSQPE